ncbi:hypothetical protein [Planomonospora venezuelensis]|uniref:Uncharacterized protein n=1 Tax=Planomonospora venezuelensis TaxID=1999 RepID=A0A841DC75_PLAVE|nr:hypothetical protein [Planomonospora venezuelensis]MBB5967721.1 hypothetical protein [Planomonospora venezuelensis]GIN03749.1 hypothetical protein Pve01_54070 [Planomonospora venezuelensis]
MLDSEGMIGWLPVEMDRPQPLGAVVWQVAATVVAGRPVALALREDLLGRWDLATGADGLIGRSDEPRTACVSEDSYGTGGTVTTSIHPSSMPVT